MLHDDDAPAGRILTRRETLALLGSSSLFLFSRGALRAAGPAKPGCVARPEQTEGPYFVDEALDRSDIRSDPADGSVRPGARLDLTLNVSRIGKDACVPLAGAIVDLWHCDAAGVYSDVRDPHFDTTGKKFLRGFQATDTNGVARFTTIYPGWYAGRAVHIHFKVRTAPKERRGHEFVSQLYFDETVTDEAHAKPPYASKPGRRRMNADDGIYRRGGSQLTVAPARARDGYAATFDLGLQGV
jgi:protocatechuate 3,4-dioxygenase beta subunit